MLLFSEPSSSTATTSSSHRRQRQRRGRTRRNPYSPPSSGLLSLLATVVSTSPVNASPVVLPFLCPGIERESSHSRREEPTSQTTDPWPAKGKGRRRRLPDRYVRGSDGLWRKADWSLYGSSMCVNCSPSTSSTIMPTADADDTVDTGVATATIITSTPTAAAPSTTSSDDIMDSLPPGWKPLNDSDHTAEILTISLSLAFFICLVMILCVIWRRGKKRQKDPEGRAHSRNPNTAHPEDLEIMIEKELKAKKKVLARATARWKANVRYTFRQRRGKRKVVHSIDSEADPPPTSITDAQSYQSSPTPSRRSSFHSVSARHSVSDVGSTTPRTGEELPILSSTPLSSSPPAYLHHPLSNGVRNVTSSGKFASSTSYTLSRRASASSLASNTLSIVHPLPYTASFHRAHVATDDKAILERLNQLVSEPDGSRLSNSHDTPNVAPVWQDEELSDFPELEAPRQESASLPRPIDEVSRVYSFSPHDSDSMSFPPPPAFYPSSYEKGKGVAVYPYEYPYHSDRSYGSSLGHENCIFDVEPEAGPSAPPFEPIAETIDASPSAPPFELDPSDISISEDSSPFHSSTSNDAVIDASVALETIETCSQNRLSMESAALSEDSAACCASTACVSVVSPELSSMADGLLEHNHARDSDGRTHEPSLST
ncbi:hypothetical protein FB446DRAFT_714290 [Lentinula raphanica]|nr:hypothetical protein FB446DRAFT_714290 [Lentinula raphanica]